MTDPIAPAPSASDGLLLGLFAIAALAFVLRLASSLVHPLNYDGYWHVFIARNLSRELGSLAHPPLFPLLLRAVDAVRHSRLSYLSISLVSGSANVLLFGLVLRKLCFHRATPVLGALALAISPSAILLSGVAEAYMLCVAFLLAAFLAYLDLVAATPPHPARARVAFSVFATLALLSHYAAGFFLVAGLAAPFVLAALEPRYCRALRRALPPRVGADAATLLLPATVAAALFHFLARPWVKALSHLPAFYFEPARETAPAFLTRTLAGTFDLFSPFQIAPPALAACALVVFVVAAAAIAVRADRRRNPALPGATAAVLLALLLLLEMTAALRGWYPFGGAMRHQIFLMVFALMAAFVAFDGLLLAASPSSRRVLVALAIVAIGANGWVHLERRWRPRPEPFSADRERFDRDFPQTREVHVDQFNLIGFFAQHHDWDWDFLGPIPGHPGRERYRLSSKGRSLELVAHRDIWTMDLRRADLYTALAETRGTEASSTFTLYAVPQALPGESAPSAETLQREIPALARQAGLEIDRLDVAGADAFAQFRRTGPAGPTP
ncbi:MAG TPA: hypothetical protein VGG65_01230 [Thermoanaerobaculia bacterium]